MAKARSSEMIASAEAKSKELRRVASEYVDQIMSQAESSVGSALAAMQNTRAAFRSIGGVSQNASVPAETAQE